MSDQIQNLIQTDEQCCIHNYGRLPFAFSRGEGAKLWDINGKEYLDFLGGIAVVLLGHSHPKITEAITRQAQTLIHTANIFYIEPQVQLAQRLSELSGGMRALFCNSGTEANEAAIKLARKYQSKFDASKFEIISVTDSFHGRTYGALAATAQPKYQEGFGPMPEGFRYVERANIDALESAICDKTAAVILEPVQGESGVWPLSNEYLQRARQLCDQHKALLIFDEIQSGMGRTGKFFAHEWAGVKADIISLAKGLANGIPIGAVLATDEVAQAFVPGSHGCTFGGNFLSCAAALATLDVLRDENLMENATNVGAYFVDQLNQWKSQSNAITEVRGRGLMVGVTLAKPIGRKVLLAALEEGLVLNAVGDSYLRFLPPLTINDTDVDLAMEKLKKAFETASAA
jgi:acetylornithine aminotransferase/acetylornithine/N-succinyldiaminopimelate aminotransferase